MAGPTVHETTNGTQKPSIKSRATARAYLCSKSLMKARPSPARDTTNIELRSWQQETNTIVASVVAALATEEFAAAIGGLLKLSTIDPARGAGYADARGCIDELSNERPQRALLRLHFALGHDQPQALTDALAKAIAQHLERRSNPEWAALAWTVHSSGDVAIHNLGVDDRWLTELGPEELESEVFSLADNTRAAYWMALRALLAAREYPMRQPEAMIAQFASAAVAQAPDSPDIAALQVLTLLALDMESEADATIERAGTRWIQRPKLLLEFLDAAQAETELREHIEERHNELLEDDSSSPALRASIARRRGFVDQLDSTNSEHAGTGFPTTLVALTAAQREESSRAAADAILGAPPRRTDAQWQATKAKGDAAFRKWLTGTFILLSVGLAILVNWIMN